MKFGSWRILLRGLAGLIKEIIPSAAVIETLVAGYGDVIDGLV